MSKEQPPVASRIQAIPRQSNLPGYSERIRPVVDIKEIKEIEDKWIQALNDKFNSIFTPVILHECRDERGFVDNEKIYELYCRSAKIGEFYYVPISHLSIVRTQELSSDYKYFVTMQWSYGAIIISFLINDELFTIKPYSEAVYDPDARVIRIRYHIQ